MRTDLTNSANDGPNQSSSSPKLPQQQTVQLTSLLRKIIAEQSSGELDEAEIVAHALDITSRTLARIATLALDQYCTVRRVGSETDAASSA